MMRGLRLGVVIATSLAVGIGLSGCKIDVDLTATPAAVSLGDQVNLKVKVTNRFNCPVRGVVAFVIPFVPRGAGISQIPDPNDRDEAQALVDRFCAAGEVDLEDLFDGGDADCELQGESLVCRIQPPGDIQIPSGLQETLNEGVVAQGTGVSCESDGVAIICRIPQAVLQTANETLEGQSGEQLPLTCGPLGPFGLCIAPTLNPGEMQMDDFNVIANQIGTFHHFVLAFTLNSGGVCRTGVLTRGTGCDEDSDCGLVSPDCADGLCSASSNPSLNGNGCDPNTPAHCPDGTCTECGEFSDGRLLTGIACETTVVGAPAPAASSWGLLGLVMGLLVLAAFMLRRYSPIA